MTGDAEDRAQAWHDQQVDEDPQHEQFPSCWCCCISCHPAWASGEGNPFYEAAKAGDGRG